MGRRACAQLVEQGGLAAANRIIDLCKNVDAHDPVYWQRISADFPMRRLFRQLLVDFGLRETEKQRLASGVQVGLAFVKSPEDQRPCILAEIRAALVAAVEDLISQQLASLPAPQELAEPTDEQIAAVPAATITHKLAGGLVSAAEYREGKHLVVATEPTSPPQAASPVAADVDPAPVNRQAVARFDAMRRAQEDLWGLSRRKQQRLLSHLERQLRDDRSSSEEEDVREAARYGRY